MKKTFVTDISQHEVNQLFEGPNLDMAQRYSNLMLLFSLTMFYTPLIPITPLITCLGGIFQYWIEKYMLLKVHNCPESMNSLLPVKFSKAVPFVVLMYGFSNFFFLENLKSSNIIGLISMIVVGGSMLVPVSIFLNRFDDKVNI